MIAVLLWLALVLAHESPRDSGFTEDVDVRAGRLRFARSGVLRVRVVDEHGRFVSGLTRDDFKLRGAAFDLVAVAETRLEPSLRFALDYTVVDGQEWRAGDDPNQAAPRELYLSIVKDLVDRFPDGRSSLALLLHGEHDWLGFAVDGKASHWAPNGEFGRLLEQRGTDLLPEHARRESALIETGLLGELESIASSPRSTRWTELQELVIVITDAVRGDPRLRYAPFCTPVCTLRPLPTCHEREAAFDRTFLRHHVIPLVVTVRPARRHVMELAFIDRALRVWMQGPATDRRRLGQAVDALGGESISSRRRSASSVSAELSREIEERLESYWLAWRVTDDESVGVSFVKVGLTDRSRGRVVPERVNGDLLLGGVSWLVPYLGPLDDMPWPLQRQFEPERARAVEAFAEALAADRRTLEAIASDDCPGTFRVRRDGARALRDLRELIASAHAGTSARTAGELEDAVAVVLPELPRYLDACEVHADLTELLGE